MRGARACVAVLAVLVLAPATARADQLAAGTGAARTSAPTIARRDAAAPTAARRDATARRGTTAPTAAAAVTATDTLALDGLRRLDTGANAVFSPFSIETALAMVDQGAGGQTAAQLDTALGGAASPAALAIANRALDRALGTAVTGHGSGGPTLDSANGVWVQSGLALDGPFSTRLADDFGAAPQQVDFASDPAGAIQTINNWISARTDGLIPSLMSPAQVTTATELVLANAVYLDARWLRQFNPGLTGPQDFATASGEVSVPFMSSGQGGQYAYAAGAGYQAVGLPYAHSSLQFLAVMPPAGQIGTLERSLTLSRLRGITRALRRQPVDLTMPKFSLSFAASLNRFLEGLGITRAFGPESQLNAIIRGRSLAIQAVQHAAVLQVAEKGTVAAAATGISAAPTAVLAREVDLTLDHPFLIFLRDTDTGAILFAARVLNPAA